jgi:hypothetical protein
MKRRILKTLIIAFLFIMTWYISGTYEVQAATSEMPYFSRAQTPSNPLLLNNLSGGIIGSLANRFSVLFNILKILLVLFLAYKALRLLNRLTGV